jgi:cell division protein FtsA
MKHKHKPKGSVLAALDIGSSKIACFVARVVDDEGNFEVLGVGHQAAAGVKNGTVTDIEAAEAAIRRAVHAAEDMAAEALRGFPLREVVVSVPGNLASSVLVNIDVGIQGQPVCDLEVRRALAKAQDQVAQADRELIHTIAAGYAIDGHGGIRDPRGMVGENLLVAVHIVSGAVSPLKNMAMAIEASHLDITALCSSAYAAGLASLVEDEMDLGCTVIDMGGGTTSLAVFHGGNLIHTDAIPVGGQHVTSDIARGLTTSLSAAERLKSLYGSAMALSSDQSEMIDVPQVGEDSSAPPSHVPRSLLVGIIQPRMEEIFEMARAKLEESGLGAVLGRRVVLTGGASQLQGVRELAQMILDKQVRLGRPIRINGLPDAVSGAAFATTAGLLTYISERSGDMPAEIVANAVPGNMFERVKVWMRENW